MIIYLILAFLILIFCILIDYAIIVSIVTLIKKLIKQFKKHKTSEEIKAEPIIKYYFKFTHIL